MLQEAPSPSAAATGRISATDPGRRHGTLHGVDRIVVQLVELLGRAMPVADVGLLPCFPVPFFYFDATVLLDAMFRPLVDQFAPLRIILGRVSPTCVNLVISGIRRPVMLVRLWLQGKLPRHEANLDVRPNAAIQIRGENP